MRYDLKELARAHKAIDAHVKKLTKYELKQFLEALIDDIYFTIDVHFPSGPESSRDEVSPSGRSPQRDCRTERVEPAIWQKHPTEPGMYEYHPDWAEQLRAEESHLWNSEAVERLDEMYDRLNVPTHLRYPR